MSASGPLLPTVNQGDLGGSPHDPLPPTSSQEVLVTSPSSAVLSPHVLSSKDFAFKEKKDEEEKTEGTATSPLVPQEVLAGRREDLIVEGFGMSQKEIALHQALQTKTEKNNGSPRQPPSGKEKSNSSRDYNTAYSEMFQDEGGGDGPAYVESDDDGAAAYRGGTPPTPPAIRAVRWAESLQNLLSDEVGADIFRQYVVNELRSSKVLDFWFACKGLEYETSVENTNELVLLIWKSFIRNKAVKVSRQTYETIEKRICTEAFDSHIFDQAQSEVEKEMNDTLYRAFLKSEPYLSFLSLGKREETQSPPSPSLPSGVCGYSFAPCTNYLPTLHEDSEYDTREKHPARLTSNNLLASASYRANIERIKPEANAGFYLKGSSSYNQSPYHITYVSGHTVSLQDSELQSLSSGAHTDDTKSYTDSSVDTSSFSLSQPMSRKHLKRQNQRMKENALQNKEPPLISSISGVHVIPRTMLNNQSSFPRADTNPEEFARILCEKLERSQQNQESRERLLQSMCKITHSEDAPEEARREHAVNALPPNVLLNKLNEKVHLDDQDPSQSILDEHVARVWDSPICSPSSPRQAYGGSPPYRGTKGNTTRQLPHLSYPHSISASLLSAYMSKCALKAGRHHTTVHTTPTTPSGVYPSLPQSMVGARGRYPTTQGVGGYGGHIPHGYQPKSGYHGRRRERGPDVYSTFSSDSGNVADYHDGSEHIPPSHLPKSKSMPEYIENHAVGATSDGASSGGRRHQGSGTRRCCRRPPADCTDSGVSVVSDSGRSGAPSSSSERVESWLFQSRPFTCGGNASYSVCPGGDRESSKEFQKVRGSRSTHTVAGSTSPGMQRRGGGSSGRRSQCSSSTSGNTCVNTRPEITSGQVGRPYEMSRDSPLGQAQPCVVGDRRKNKGGSSSSKSTGQGSSVGDGSGSNGSTLKKHQKSSKSGELPPPQLGTHGGTPAPSCVPADITTIVYSFQDDHVPFIIKVPSRPVTLKKFKQHLHKKGSYRYFFKKFCEDMGMVYEEITDDAEILPLFEGKVFVQIHKDD